MSNRFNQLINQIIHYAPRDGQLQQAQEELNELNLAISKYRRKSGEYSTEIDNSWMEIIGNLKEEIADVYIMLAQLVKYFDCEIEVEELMLQKLVRTIDRMRGFDD